ncbi:MAG: serine/threonine protein kinase [Acidobacteria bacterium]|nr:serine/threonine protein kinase [Acidobacteriota bacterium]
MRGERSFKAWPAGRRGDRIRLFGAEGGLSRRFEIKKVLSRTHAGLCAEAFDRERNETVFLRLLSPARLPPKTSARILREMASAKALNNRFLWPILDVGSERASLFLTAPLPTLPDLRSVASEAPLPVREAIGLIRQIAKGLSALHGMGILHRNLHPETVLVDPETGVKLAGYGLEERWESCEAEQVAYVAPEQAAFGLAHEASDLYSLGAIAFLLLTGQPPLVRTSPLATAVAHVREKAPRVDLLRPGIPRWLGGVIAKLLERQEADRYGSVDEFLDDFERQRAPRRKLRPRQKMLVVSGSFLVLAALLFSLPQAPWNRPRLAVLAADPGGGIVASDSTGLVLWSRPDVRLPDRAALVAEGPSGAAEVAAILGEDRTQTASPMLSYLDGLSGTELRRVSLPFPGAKQKAAVVAVEAVPNAGQTGTLVTVTLRSESGGTYWTVLHAPGDPEASLAFVSSSPHHVLGSMNVLGSGSLDLVIGGEAPWLGGYHGIAALPLSPQQSAYAPPELRPDRVARPLPPVYALAPACGEASVAAGRQTIAVGTWKGRMRLLGEGLFPRGRASASAAPLRTALRERVYELILRSRDQVFDGLLSEALARLDEARDCSASAGDPYLSELLERCRLAIAAPSLSLDERAQRYESLIKASEAPPLVGLDAAGAFHEAGDPDRARSFYLDAIRATFGPQPARSPREALLEGILLLEAEQGGAPAVHTGADRLAAILPGLLDDIDRTRRGVLGVLRAHPGDPDFLAARHRRILAGAGAIPLLLTPRRAPAIREPGSIH